MPAILLLITISEPSPAFQKEWLFFDATYGLIIKFECGLQAG